MSWPRRGPDLDKALPVHVHKSIEGCTLLGICFWDCERAMLLMFAYAVDAATSSCQVASQFQADMQLSRCLILAHLHDKPALCGYTYVRHLS